MPATVAAQINNDMTNLEFKYYNGCGHRGVANYIGVWLMGVIMVPEAILEKLEPMRQGPIATLIVKGFFSIYSLGTLVVKGLM